MGPFETQVEANYAGTVYQYKFEVVSPTRVKRTNLITLEEEIFGPTPNAKGESIHLAEYLNRHTVFGAKGNEYWYGGKVEQCLPLAESELDVLLADSRVKKAVETINKKLKTRTFRPFGDKKTPSDLQPLIDAIAATLKISPGAAMNKGQQVLDATRD